MSEDFTQAEPVAYNRLKTPFARHSGDFTFAPPPDGASEFIDVDLDRALELGFRYVSMDVRVYMALHFYITNNVLQDSCFAKKLLRVKYLSQRLCGVNSTSPMMESLHCLAYSISRADK